MFIWDWISGALNYLGLWRKSGKLLFLGLDNSGKTTLLNILKGNRMTQHAPTWQATSEELTIGRITFTAFDLGGHVQARRVWRDYFPTVDAIIFLIDSVDYARLDEAKKELESLLKDDHLSNCPLLVLGNKIDVPGSVSEDQLRHILGLYGNTTGKQEVARQEMHGRPIELFMCSILKGQGYGDGFRWISQYLE